MNDAVAVHAHLTDPSNKVYLDSYIQWFADAASHDSMFDGAEMVLSHLEECPRCRRAVWTLLRKRCPERVDAAMLTCLEGNIP